jgi:hypothetical protein
MRSRVALPIRESGEKAREMVAEDTPVSFASSFEVIRRLLIQYPCAYAADPDGYTVGRCRFLDCVPQPSESQAHFNGAGVFHRAGANGEEVLHRIAENFGLSRGSLTGRQG